MARRRCAYCPRRDYLSKLGVCFDCRMRLHLEEFKRYPPQPRWQLDQLDQLAREAARARRFC